ncbi:glycerophosphodiester phosphodiesterase family protein [Dickeya dadantii subsp. dieffenbachiae]|uniref:glycerophosphodiester phosphodiesterase family protein n=1 Tax=Dickeya dadantii TaxID=204038 RepID=UPI0003A3A6F4|nr:glycerophosphodiester phosphodiesterase family protein [Dickeya dadantii]
MNFIKSVFIVIVTGIVFFVGNVQATTNWNPEHILEAFKFPYANGQTTVGIIAHRGMVADGCPENSQCSIDATANNNIEAIELDVKQSAQGTPWLFHDQNAGRMLYHLPLFDIFQDRNPPIGWDPDFRTMTDNELAHSYLRDKNFSGTRFHPLSVLEALRYIKVRAPHLLVILDIKTSEAVFRCASIVKDLNMENQVVLKSSASLYADKPPSFDGSLAGIHFVPTIYAGDFDNIAMNFTNVFCNAGVDVHHCRAEGWIKMAYDYTASPWVEIGNKSPDYPDPTSSFVAQAKRYRRAIGSFVPVPEYNISQGNGAYYVRSNGTCCARLTDYLTNTRYFGNERVDRRESVELQLNSGFTNIITDNPLQAIRLTSARGLRHTERYE